MARRDNPYLPLYVQDFLSDEKLAYCSASATGVYIRIMCIMHKSETYGKILLKQKFKQNDKQIKNFASQLAIQMPYDFNTILCALEELVDSKVLSEEPGALIQKRMVRDDEISELRASAGREGGKKSVVKSIDKKDNPEDFAQAFASDFAQAKMQANSENEYIYENNIREEIDKGGKGEKGKEEKENSKIAYAEFVSMTNDEYSSLVAKLGNEQDARRCIDVLDNYKGSSGKKYKSDYRAILTWVIPKLTEESKLNVNNMLSRKTQEDLKRMKENKMMLDEAMNRYYGDNE
jgi:hypothetical protein